MTKSIIDLLKKERVLDIYGKGKFTLIEEGDRRFSVELTIEQMRQLGREIIDMAGRYEP